MMSSTDDIIDVSMMSRPATSKRKRGSEHTRASQNSEPREAEQPACQQGETRSGGQRGQRFQVAGASAVVAELVRTPVSRRAGVGGVSTTGPVFCPVPQLLNAQEIPV